MKGDFTTTANQVYYWFNCSDANEAADTQTIIYTANAKVYARNWSGALTVKNMAAGSELIVDGAGRVVIDSTCTGGTINIRGNFPAVTDNVVGGFTVAGGVLTQSARYATDQITTAATAATPTVTLANGAHGGAAASIVLADYSAFKATSVTVSDKTGFSLVSTGLDLVTAWTVDITGTVSGNSTHDAAAVVTALGTGSGLTALATATNLATANTTLGKIAPRLIGTLSGAGTGTEVCVYSGTTVTYTVDEDGNISNVAFS